jgi:hypothetical protein
LPRAGGARSACQAVEDFARAARIVGGPEALRKRLNVSALLLGVWLAGTEAPPTDVFLKAVDIIETYKTSLKR